MKLPSDYANDMANALEGIGFVLQGGSYEDDDVDEPRQVWITKRELLDARKAVEAYREWQSRLSGRVVPLRAESSEASSPVG